MAGPLNPHLALSPAASCLRMGVTLNSLKLRWILKESSADLAGMRSADDSFRILNQQRESLRFVSLCYTYTTWKKLHYHFSSYFSFKAKYEPNLCITNSIKQNNSFQIVAKEIMVQ